MGMNPLLLTDFYKVGHPFQYPKNTQYVYSNLTPRQSMLKGVDSMLWFGLQMFIKKYLIEHFNKNFFDRDRQEVLDEYKRIIENTIGALPSYDHIEELHVLGYLPIEIKSLEEGELVPMRVACVTIVNTNPKFYWLTNFIETLFSCSVWQASTSATIAYEYRRMFNFFADETGMPEEFVQWQGHDFSMRGMSSLESAVMSGMGHLLSFTGSDTIPAILGHEEYYNADVTKELVSASVTATEHSVQCAGGKDGEIETFTRLLTEVQPSGIISIVSDTWDLWKVLTDFLPKLKDMIMARDGKLVIRPDSGDPADILCGDLNEPIGSPAYKGVIELLWDTFGGTETPTGYKLLDEHIGAIYGDSITRERAIDIAERLMAKGFAFQPVFGIGSFTYQYNTRDTFGTAVKSTNVVVDGESRPIFKDPITGSGFKKSAKGLLRIEREDGKLVQYDEQTLVESKGGLLRTVYKNGRLIVDDSLSDIRYRVNSALKANKINDRDEIPRGLTK